MKVKFWIIIAALFLLVIFVAQNYEKVEIKFLFWAFTTSRAIILFLTLITGMVIGWSTALLKNKTSQTQTKTSYKEKEARMSDYNDKKVDYRE
ncbi:MAG: LapA family protein [Candidatus Omnitrophota bacterium]